MTYRTEGKMEDKDVEPTSLVSVLPVASGGGPTVDPGSTKSLGRLSASGSTREMECHVIVESAPRSESYNLIADQLGRKTAPSLEQVLLYLGRDHNDDVVSFKLCDGGVDVVRSRKLATPMGTFAAIVWDTLTTPVQTDQWTLKCLEHLDENTFYTQVTLHPAPPPPLGPPLARTMATVAAPQVAKDPLVVLHLVQKRFRSKDRLVLAFRNVTDDAQFPVPMHGSARVRVNGWIIFEMGTRDHTVVRTLVKFRASRHTTRSALEMEIYLETIASTLFQICDSATRSKLRRTSAISSGSQRSPVRDAKRGHNSASGRSQPSNGRNSDANPLTCR
ncbi:Aste57867_807 [Aphanomyces stellatus]|uniref:Aste57867_807 protein n=1 Tax=Aphanomyces stellatus TaxID=120398 RepID=A0A485K8T1_9STRA|nr:hypothetical protein As57867_000806 [Aphanomyces stellatus]VFT78031.1 Aste57867_807 [Aphanomyces stellatus]